MLNEIVHPRIIERVREIIEQELPESSTIYVVEAALILECGTESDFDVIVVVDADPTECVERVVGTRNLEREEVTRITELQMRSNQKKVRANLVIENDGSLDELREKAIEAFKFLTEMESERRT